MKPTLPAIVQDSDPHLHPPKDGGRLMMQRTAFIFLLMSDEKILASDCFISFPKQNMSHGG
jgi:hypothetical protein